MNEDRDDDDRIGGVMTLEEVEAEERLEKQAQIILDIYKIFHPESEELDDGDSVLHK